MIAPKNKIITEKINNEEMYNFFTEMVNNNTFWRDNVGLRYLDQEEEKYGFSITSYMDVFKNFNNLQLIYTKEDSKKQINMVEDLQSIFSNYFKIPGLERLIATNYTDIEWSMFLEQNFEKNESKRTRDHFQHQFRNAFLGCKLLYSFQLIENVLTCIKDKETVFSYYINNSIDKQIKISAIKDNEKEIVKEDYKKEIVFKSYLLAAMFHDVGYPIEYYLRESRQIQKFIPFYKIIDSNIKTEFVEIKSILIDSQLFSVIDNDEIEKKYSKNDHGVFSAISFLYNFYLSGSIFSMSIIDRCIIEIAAIAIYNHTNKYKGNERMIFNNDPISYLLRTCDDLQEWSRFSLCVDNTSNMLRCKCYGMFEREELSEERSEIKYICQTCGESFTKVTSLEYKKIHYLSLCNEMKISKENGNINVEIKYDLYKQLELLLNDYTSVKYRNDDLENVKKALKFQNNLPDIKVDKFLSNNPCILTRRILGIEEDIIVITKESLMNENEKYKIIVMEITKFNKKIIDDFINEINKVNEYSNEGIEIETNMIKYCEKSKKFVAKYIGIIKAFYDSGK